MATIDQTNDAVSDDPGVASGQLDGIAASYRRCTGSRTFGIEAHEAPIDDFPVQPSRKDGLGTMCKEHWTAYTRSLRQASRARQAAGIEPEPTATHTQNVEAAERRRARAGKAPKPTIDPALAAAAALVQDVDALPAPEMARRVGDDDVQAALETIAKANGRHAPDAYELAAQREAIEQARVETTLGEATADATDDAEDERRGLQPSGRVLAEATETPPGEAIDSGTEEADVDA